MTASELNWKIALSEGADPKFKEIWDDYTPTSDWTVAGRLIEKYKVSVHYETRMPHYYNNQWVAFIHEPGVGVIREYDNDVLVAVSKVIVLFNQRQHIQTIKKLMVD